jgi:transformation/transcription domain-associated protein
VFRVHLLELIQRFASTEFVRPQAETLIPLVLEIIRTDNEDMGVLALKTFMDMYRNVASRPSMDNHIAEFFNLLVDIYSQMPQVVGTLFSASGAAMQEPDQTTYTKAKASLKLVAELPAAACFIYQGVNPNALEVFMKGSGRGLEVLDTSVSVSNRFTSSISTY